MKPITDNLIELDSGIYTRLNLNHNYSDYCSICGILTFYSGFYCPESDALIYWRKYFEALNCERAINEDNKTLIICSKACWLKLIEPIKSNILIRICDKTWHFLDNMVQYS